MRSLGAILQGVLEEIECEPTLMADILIGNKPGALIADLLWEDRQRVDSLVQASWRELTELSDIPGVSDVTLVGCMEF